MTCCLSREVPAQGCKSSKLPNIRALVLVSVELPTQVLAELISFLQISPHLLLLLFVVSCLNSFLQAIQELGAQSTVSGYRLSPARDPLDHHC